MSRTPRKISKKLPAALKTTSRGTSAAEKSNTEDATPDNTAIFPVVGIGASAGGLEALEQFLKHVPEASGMAFVVIQHLDPTHKGMLPELLERCTSTPVAQAQDRTRVERNHVYVIPPNKDLSILHGVLHLLEPVSSRGQRLPIDYFLRSLAEDSQEWSVGVILSGMGSDGTLGLRAIKEHAGLCLAQDCTEAKFDSMPGNAIKAGLVDIVASAREMPRKIITYLTHAIPLTLSSAEQDQRAQGDLDKIVLLLRMRTGRDFAPYKKSSVLRRIERRMSIHQLNRTDSYIRYLRENPAELDLLFRELLIGVTSFFRDQTAWTHMKEQALPAVLAGYPDGGTLRAWVSACSTGEEAYTLAIAFCEAVQRTNLSARHSLKIFATDLDRFAIDGARRGVYPPNIAADVRAEDLKRYFVKHDNGYRICNEIRDMVTFAPQDVLLDPPFTKLDILCCRNLLIYLTATAQRKLMSLFHFSLNPGGVLFLGSAETVGSVGENFEPMDAKSRIYRRMKSTGTSNALEFPTGGTPIAPNTRPVVNTRNRPNNLQAFAERLVLQNLSPAAVLTTISGDILYISGRTGKYLEPASGGANWSVYAMAREGLRNALSDAMHRALADSHDVTAPGLTVTTDGGKQHFDLRVQIVKEKSELDSMLLISFTETAAPSPTRRRRTHTDAARGAREIELEAELQLARTETTTLREDMQTTQEELKSTNEELQSTNEELQSTNEELTTSKEEMQSMNEELQTVNAELQAKLTELMRADSDMRNLLNSTDIATVFLDADLHIRRFTDSAQQVFKLIPGDVGRPLSDIVCELDYPKLANDAQSVLHSLIPVEKLLGASDDRLFKVRIMPYRTLANVIDGVVITLVNITDYRRILSTLPDQRD